MWRVLRRYGLNARTKRLSFVAGYAARYERRPDPPEPPRHIEASRPGRSSASIAFGSGVFRAPRARSQYTAIDVASGFAWAELHSTPKNPRARFCRALVARVAEELAAAGWRLEAVISDNGSEFRSGEFKQGTQQLDVEHRFIRAGRPTSNGHVERLQLTILEECWRPTFARSLIPKLTALERDLEAYLWTYNFDRAHTGRLTKGRVPGDIVYGARKTRPAR